MCSICVRNKLNFLKKLALWGIIILLCAYSLFPLIWTGLTSIKERRDFFGFPPKLIFTPTLSHYRTVFERTHYPHYLANSIMVALSSTFISVLFGSLAGYAFARFRVRREKFLMFWILSMRMMPPLAIIVPFFLIYRKLALYDTIYGVSLAHMTFNLPIVVWVMNGYFRRMPKEIEEAALVDGCSFFGAFRRIVLPLSLPGLTASALLCFIFSWNEFAFAKLLTGENARTIPAAIFCWYSAKGIDWGALSASGILAVLPVVILIIAAGRGLTYGLTFGALKE